MCQDGPPGQGWDGVWGTPCNQEEIHVSGVLPKARSGTLASRLSPYNQKRTQGSSSGCEGPPSFGDSEGRQLGGSG